ncbi:pimeloyl-ACP methyl ester carboxylesterase [Marmoricola sp. OAE513]|uniref:CocE/NonD family hydrolase n=1 Tax=Marmoricola sp. OAE513 TaxID=2817894 RepID=UPI001AE88C8E
MRRFSRRLVLLLALATAAVTVVSLGSAAPSNADLLYKVQTLHFKVPVGHDGKYCDIVGDVYKPILASGRNKVPAVMATNGFGGSKDDQAQFGRGFAQRGYGFLSYSGLGFGGSGCKITLDDPDYDGLAGSVLISYLGGGDHIAYLDAKHTKPAPPVDWIQRDKYDHNGDKRTADPRVGMVGGSYGGQIQFAIASRDARLDAIVPIITWNDLTYSLGPNNTSQVGIGTRTRTPGATKLTWGLGFSALGIVNGLQHAPEDPTRLLPCPNFADFVCPALVHAGTLGYFDDASAKALRHASVGSYISRIKIPTLVIQGENDTLFNLNEGIANYSELQRRGVETKMIWQSWGHSQGTPAPGEFSRDNLNPVTQYETGRIFSWFEKYLRGRDVDTGPEFAYFRDWVKYSGNAKPAYATSSTFPVGSQKPFYLSGKNLVSSAVGLTRASQAIITAPAGVPTNLSTLDAIGFFAKAPALEGDLPGTTATWDTAALTRSVAVAGTPKLTLKVDSPIAAATQAIGPAGQLVLFVRVQDVGPDGKATDINILNAPVRVADVTKPFNVKLPAFVHQFGTGHRIRLVVSSSSVNYRGGLLSNVVTIPSGSSSQVLTLPVVG